MAHKSAASILSVLISVLGLAGVCRAQSGQLISATVFPEDSPAIHLPDGLIAELAAAPPLTRHPMMASLDDRGRLFIAEAAGVNRNADQLSEEKPNSIRMLEDTDHDGIFDRATVFADRMTFPSGTLWHEGALWVTAAPSIWRLEDTDDDGVADKREEMVTGFGYTGNAADLHGPFLHPNGRIFWCHGRKELDVHDKEGKPIHKGKGARIWSCESDGSDVQIYAGGGMDNPVEIDFTPEGEIVGTINLMYGRPRGDTLVHWQYGGVYPRYDQETVLAEFSRTGDLLTEFHNFGHVAVSGIGIYRSPIGLGGYAGELFTAHFNTQKITRTKVATEQATFRHLRTQDFLVIDDPNAHLTDVFEDADGTLLVIDTGGWVRNGCPTSQYSKPQIAGAIYRIRKAGTPDRKTDFRGLEIDWTNSSPEKIAGLLGDERFAVRDRAIAELAKRGDASLRFLDETLEHKSVDARRNAVWALTRIGSAKARAIVRKALKDSEPTVRHTACNSIWQTRDNKAVEDLVNLLLEEENPSAQMAAARALGRIGDPYAVDALLQYAARPLGRAREHATVYALIEINDFAATARGLSRNSPEVQKRALWALNEMPASSLTAGHALPFFDSESETLAATAVAICKFHPEWAGEIASVFHGWLDDKRLTERRLIAVNELAPYFLENETMRSFVGGFFASSDPTAAQRGFRLISQSPQNVALNASWTKAVERALSSGDSEWTSQALDAVAKIDSRRFDTQLRAISDDTDRGALIRIKALGAISRESGPMTQAAFVLLREILGAGSGSSHRIEAAGMLSGANLTRKQRLEVASLIKVAGPLELPLLLNVFEQSNDAATGYALVEALESSPVASAHSPFELQRMLTHRFPPEVYDRAKPWMQTLFDLAEQRQSRLDEMGLELESGNPTAGREVIVSGKGACIACHKIGEEGRAVGPDLSRIGLIRTKKDLLESILYPDVTLARDFEPYQIQTVDGQTLLGVIQRETADTLFLLDATAVAKPIPRSSIKTIQPGTVSLMPQGLDQTMTKKELIDLVAYLDTLE